jgi:hypothetical protein
MKCEDAIRDMPLLAYGELSFAEEDALTSHIEACAGCQVEYKRVQALHEAVDRAEADIPAHLLVECRRRLRASAGAIEAGPRGSRLWNWLFGDWNAWAKPAGAVALVALGFFGGRMGSDRRTEPVQVVSAPADTFSSPVASRVRFVEPADDGRVQIVLEETRQRVLSGAASDANIRRLLLSAARESQDAGLRVNSVDILSAEQEDDGEDQDEIRPLLLYALQHDPNPGVRLRALNGLRDSVDDPEIRKTLARVLLTDANPGVRTQAIDLLIQQHEPEVIGVLQEALRKDENNYVRMKCQKALHEMRASAESF